MASWASNPPLLAVKPKPRTYPCRICGRHDAAENMIYSPKTGDRFCGVGRGCDGRRQ